MESLFRSLLNRYRLQIGIFLVTVVVVGGAVLVLMNARSNPPEIHKIEKSSSDQTGESMASPAPSEVQQKLKVDVAGAVVNPGVYELFENARIEEALNASGGLSDEADRDWVSKNLNLAAKLSDGDKIYIFKVGETTSAPSSADTPVPVSLPSSAGVVSGVGSSDASNCSRVNINTASAGTLDDCLSGIGPAYSQKIVEYREAHGGFKSIEEIQEVRGIGPKTFAKIKDQITVN